MTTRFRLKGSSATTEFDSWGGAIVSRVEDNYRNDNDQPTRRP